MADTMSGRLPSNGSARRLIEVLLAVFSIIGGGSGIYAITAAKDWGALEERVRALERGQEQTRVGGQQRGEVISNMGQRITRLEEEEAIRRELRERK